MLVVSVEEDFIFGSKKGIPRGGGWVHLGGSCLTHLGHHQGLVCIREDPHWRKSGKWSCKDAANAVAILHVELQLNHRHREDGWHHPRCAHNFDVGECGPGPCKSKPVYAERTKMDASKYSHVMGGRNYGKFLFPVEPGDQVRIKDRWGPAYGPRLLPDQHSNYFQHVSNETNWNGLEKLFQPQLSVYFQGDTANGYWTVPLTPEHAYKTAFNTHMGQYQCLRIGQGLQGAPQMYSW